MESTISMYLFGERILVMCVDGHVAMIFTLCEPHFFRRPVSTAEPDLKQLVESGMDTSNGARVFSQFVWNFHDCLGCKL